MRSLFSYTFLMPPTIFLVINLLGAMIAFINIRLGSVLSLLSGICLYGFATPAVSMLLMQHLVSYIPTNADFSKAQAIIVPCADMKWDEGANAVGELTLERLASAALLYRRLRLPIVVSGGGTPDQPNISAASLMRQELEHNFSVPVQYLEDRAANTFENAWYTSQILSKTGIYNVVVVAQARDIPRLLWSFKKAGLRPIPFMSREPSFASLEIEDFLPSAKEFVESYYELHEIIGLAYYRMFY